MLWFLFLVLFFVSVAFYFISIFRDNIPQTEEDFYVKAKQFYSALNQSAKKILFRSLLIFLVTSIIVFIILLNILTKRDLQNNPPLKLENNFSTHVCDFTYSKFSGLTGIDLCVNDTGTVPRKRYDGVIHDSFIDGIVLHWSDAFSEKRLVEGKLRGFVYLSEEPPLEVTVPFEVLPKGVQEKSFDVEVRGYGTTKFEFYVSFIGIIIRAFESVLVGLLFGFLYLLLALTIFNKAEVNTYLAEKGEIMLPEKYNEELIRSELTKIQNNPSMLGHFYDQFKTRFLYGQSDRTVQERTKFLLSEQEKLKAIHGIREVQVDLKLQELEAEIRLKTLQLEDDDLQHKQQTENEIRDLENQLRKSELERKIAEEEEKKRKTQPVETPKPQKPPTNTSLENEKKIALNQKKIQEINFQKLGAEQHYLKGRSYDQLSYDEKAVYDELMIDYDRRIHALKEEIEKLRR